MAVLAVLLGSTAFDSFSTPSVENFVYDYEKSIPFVSALVGGTLLRTAGLLIFIVIVAVTFWQQRGPPAASTGSSGADSPANWRIR